jgi:phosphoglycolate phosphatase
MPLKAVLCDLDGTLVDSAEDIRAALNELLAELRLNAVGPDAVGPEEIKGMIGDGVGKLIERALAARGGDPAEAPHLVPRFLALYEPNAARSTRPYPGVPETLRALKARGLRVAVVTNKPETATREILASLDLAALVDVIVGGDTAPERKPHPAPVLLALERLRVTPDDAVMVGDNHHDVAAARAAGVPAIAVTYGYSHVPQGDLGADRLIATFPELLAVLELPA